MLKVTCFHCGHNVEISPDSERCPVCGANLRRFIAGEQASRYFYNRAADISSKGDLAAALKEVQRGLAYQPSSELHLLAAILCKRSKRPDEMRHHVAAIPVDDVLRGEAEWLLRSHQTRWNKKESLPDNKARRGPVAAENSPTRLDEVQPTARGRRTHGGLWATATFLALIGVGTWFFWPELSPWVMAMLNGGGAVPAPAPPELPAVPTGDPASPTESAGVPTATMTGEPAPATATTAAPATVPTPTDVPSTMADTEGAPEIANSDASSPAKTTNTRNFNLAEYLIEAGRRDLADYQVAARFEGAVLILEGWVPMAVDREELELLAKAVPGVEEVVMVNVKVRPPATYTVQSGDTLWGIAAKIYGSANKVAEMRELNGAAIGPNDLLSEGLVLKLPE
jgi:nucleoid-associated protein YgaU